MDSQITPWLKNQTVLLTGGTGFLGKVIIWKLLHEAGDGLKIYALVRPSKSTPAKARLQTEIFSAKIFDDLFMQRPHLKDRVIPIEGDITQENFGISEHDSQIIESEVTVIIHSAATTRFTEAFKLAVELNTCAVQRVIKIARKCSKLVSLVHISTCYVGSDYTAAKPLPELVHPVKYNPYDVMEKTKNMTPEEADKWAEKIMPPFPNTYTFTKALGEHVLEAERGNLPISVVRPSIVTASVKEPMPGWVDVLLGPGGLFLAVGMGALRVMHGSSNNLADFIPVDLVVNGIIASAYANASHFNPDPASKPTPIYQIASSDRNPVRWLTPRMIVPQYFIRHRPKRNFGYPFAFFCHRQWSFHLASLIMHWLPASLADLYRIIQGKKPFNLKSLGKVLKAVGTLSYFTSNSWHFLSGNADKLHMDLNEDDREIYNSDPRSYDWDIYMMIKLHGMRKYLLKEEEEPKGKKEEVVEKKEGFLAMMMGYLRPYLFLISLGCFLYLFRQNFWALRIKARQLRDAVLRSMSPVLKITQ